MIELDNVSLWFDDGPVLVDISWRVEAAQHWVIVGANGAGKTSLLKVASLHQHPSRGRVRVLGEELGRCDLRALRTRIGLSSPALAARLEPTMDALHVVMTAFYGALAPWWHTYGPDDHARGHQLLERFGVDEFANHGFETMSAGERQRTLLARAMARNPELLFLDEPTAGLDIGAREQVLGNIAAITLDPTAAPTVVVTHHLEEIPAGVTHALVLRRGSVLAQGPVLDVLTSPVLSECFGVGLVITHEHNRFAARLA